MSSPTSSSIAGTAASISATDSDTTFILSEIESALAQDIDPRTGKLTLLALTYNDHETHTPAELAVITQAKIGGGTAGFLSNIRTYWLGYLLRNELPDGLGAVTYKTQKVSPVRAFLKRNRESFSPVTIAYLEDMITKATIKMQTAATTSQGGTFNLQPKYTVTPALDPAAQPCIYVVTKTSYEDNPIDPKTGNTLYKIGYSNISVNSRLGWGRATYEAEAPIVKRIYTKVGITDYHQVEKDFHAAMSASGVMNNPHYVKGKTGTEWFLTSLEFTDMLAKIAGMDIHEVEEE